MRRSGRPHGFRPRELRARASYALSLVVALTTAAACSGEKARPASALPSAEFLFAAGDSTYWVHASDEGLRVRSAPILLTHVDGALYEVFLSDDGADYTDATFASSTLWARGLKGRDSVALFADSSVHVARAAWRRAHPNEAEIDPNDDDSTEDPRTVVQDEIEILDAHGPYLTFEHLLNMDIDGGPAHRHEGHRFVVDVRSGRRMALTDLLGEAEARRTIDAARTSLSQITDSIRAAGRSGDERAAAAVETLDSFVFDPQSFGITDIARDPAIAFMIPGKSSDGEALALHLPPIRVAAPAWWAGVRATLPTWARDSATVTWSRGGYEVTARPSADGDALALVLSPRAAGREWPVRTVGAPAYQLISLDTPPLDSAGRSALARAFDVSTALDGQVQRASRRIAPRRSFTREARLTRTATTGSRALLPLRLSVLHR